MAAPYEKIACFIDQDAASESALAEAQRLQGFGDCELNLVHIAPEPIALYSAPYAYLTVAEDFYPRAREWIEDRARRAGATPVLLSGLPARAACDFATSAGIDLMIAAAHRGVVRRAVLGGFASYIAYHAPCPVLLVHPPLPEAGSDEVGTETVASVTQSPEGGHHG